MPPAAATPMLVAMTEEPLHIETAGLSKRFGQRSAVEDVDLAVPRGCAFGLLGHNGAGKTTLIRLLVGLMEADAGRIRIGGRRLEGDRLAVLGRVGAIVEEPRFHGHLTGRENLGVVAAVRGPAARRRIAPALARVGLADRAGERVSRYSQGMRQRLGIARCLLADPELLILDEPTNGLDPGGIRELRALIADLVAEGRTVVVSSHLLDEIEKTCQAAAVLDRGRLIAQGPVATLLGADEVEFEIACDPVGLALSALAEHPAVRAARVTRDGIRVVLHDAAATSALAARLVEAGVAVTRFAPLRTSLEERFLELTSRLGDAT
jgi:ABC-2 type transport system ATP-binding protein